MKPHSQHRQIKENGINNSKEKYPSENYRYDDIIKLTSEIFVYYVILFLKLSNTMFLRIEMARNLFAFQVSLIAAVLLLTGFLLARIITEKFII